ncbi:MAG: GNAT family N-acetyltransferase [Chthonomonadales bacterium]
MNVHVLEANEQEKLAVKNLFTAYFLDLSGHDDNIHINEYGLPVFYVDGKPPGAEMVTTTEECVTFNWWIRDDCITYIIRVEDLVAGFAFVCQDRRQISSGVDNELVDFYVAPPFRNQGVGTAAARQIFRMHDGTWQVFQLPRNTGAIRFWHRIINNMTGGRFELLDNGTQQRFRLD